MSFKITFLMCSPDNFEVDYVINPWMEGNIHKSSRARAMIQWKQLFSLLQQYADVDLIQPQPNLPDMVFTANAGLIWKNNVVLSRFRHRERQGEESFFKSWFVDRGFIVYELPQDIFFEGAGDALIERNSERLWAGYGFRSQLSSHKYLAQYLGVEIISLRLVNELFYHLDTCFCPLENGYLLYYPAAFDADSNRLIEMHVTASKRIAVTDEDAYTFACNAVNIGKIILLNRASSKLKDSLINAGFEVKQTHLDEFLKSGGAAKCLTLRLTESAQYYR